MREKGRIYIRSLVDVHLIQVTYNIFIATIYMTKQDSLKVTNRDVHQVE